MKDIFISYASDDRERVKPIIHLLENQGWSVWWDRKIPIGKTFDDEIEKALDDAKCIVVIWSKKSVESKWVRNEANEGESRGVLIPIQIDEVKIPLAFRRIETTQLQNWKRETDHPELSILIDAVARFAGNPPLGKLEYRNIEKSKRKTNKFSGQQRNPIYLYIASYVLQQLFWIGVAVNIAGLYYNWTSGSDLATVIFWAVLGAVSFYFGFLKLNKSLRNHSKNGSIAVNILSGLVGVIATLLIIKNV